MVGHFVYFGTEGVLGEARKPWLGENQEGGSDGIGTAKRRVDNLVSLCELYENWALWNALGVI